MSLNNFISEIKKDGMQLSKPFLFEVQMYGTQNGSQMKFLCHDANLPSWSIDTVPHRIYGYVVEMPASYQQGHVSLSFYVDRALGVMKTFEDMKAQMFNTTNYSLKYRDSYSFQTSIIIYDVDNMSPVATYLLHECYLKTVAQTNWSWANTDAVQNVSIELSYDHFEAKFHKLTSSPNKPSAKGILDSILDNRFFKGSAIDNVRKAVNDATEIYNKIPPINFDTVKRLMPKSLSSFKASTDDSYTSSNP